MKHGTSMRSILVASWKKKKHKYDNSKTPTINIKGNTEALAIRGTTLAQQICEKPNCPLSYFFSKVVKNQTLTLVP